MTTPKKASGRLKIAVDDTVKKVNLEAASRGMRAVNAIRNAELEVLSGKRSGRVYRKPYTKSHYTASAPGEPPARRTGNLRLNWNGTVESSSTGSGLRVTAVLESQSDTLPTSKTEHAVWLRVRSSNRFLRRPCLRSNGFTTRNMTREKDNGTYHQREPRPV